MIFKIDGNEFKVPQSWKENYHTIENVSQSEAGTDLSTVTRFNKLTLQITTIVDSRDKSKLKNLSETPFVRVQIGEAFKICRLRNFTAELIPKSDKFETTEGLWTVTYNLEEI